MKNKIALATAALVAGSSFSTAEIVINDFLSFEGFIDMSYSHTEQDVDGDTESDNSFGIDQVEISWLFDFDPVTAQIDLAYEGSDGDSGIVEQAFATYHFDNGGAVTAGRFASMLGFEAFEPTGLYQYSFAYNDAEDVPSGFAFISGGVLPLYDQGVKITYETDTSFFGLSLIDSVDVGRLNGDGASDFGIEAAAAFDLGNGVSWFGGIRYDEGNDNTGGFYDDSITLDTYITFETGAWIFAAELAYQEIDFGGSVDQEIIQGLLMANFAYSDAASVTGRVSFVDGDSDLLGEEDFVKFTLAHGYAFTDNLFLVNEVSYVDGEDAADNDVEELHGAVELIFSF